MDVIVLLVGDELLRGHTRDANLHWLAQRLDGMGHRVVRAEVLPDDDAVLGAHLLEALDEAALVVVTGGLGPTHDDRTTAVIAGALDLDLAVHEKALERMGERYRRFRGRDPAPNVVEAARKMARIPERATPLANEVGTALGYALEARGSPLVVLPGVPREMQDMWDRAVAGAIVPDEGRQETVEEVTVGLPEAEFSDVIASLQEDHPDVQVGSYPRVAKPAVTVRLRGPEAKVAACADDLRARLPDHIRKPD